MTVPCQPFDERFWKYVNKTETCWLWTGGKHNFGYGNFFIKKIEGRPKFERAHRISWTMFHGPIPKGMLVLHKCDVPACLNPEHLFLGTHQDNMRDKCQKKRHGIGQRNSRAILTDAGVKFIKTNIELKSMSHAKVANIFGVSKTAIADIRKRKRWAHIT